MSRSRPRDTVRRDALDARRTVEGAAAAAAARSAATLADRMSALRGAAEVGSYAARDGELDPAPLEALLAARGVGIWHPAVRGDELMWGRWSPGDATETGEFGIRVPVDATVASPPLDAVIVPLVAVDRRGHRLGHGRGFYDRALAGPLSSVQYRIGYAHDAQVVDEIAPAPWDEALHAIVTPTELIIASEPDETEPDETEPDESASDES